MSTKVVSGHDTLHDSLQHWKCDNPIFPLVRVGGSPHQHEFIDYIGDSGVLANQEDPRTRSPTQ